MTFARRRAGALGALALLGAMAPAATGGAHPLRPHTTEADSIINIHVKMTNVKYVLSRKSGKRGADARFILVNTTDKKHSFTFGKQGPGHGAMPSVTVPVGPRKRVVMTVLLDYAGKVKYGAAGADSGKPGMRGYFEIKA